jgi:quercetin dioxygenase-like cupin family protein
MTKWTSIARDEVAPSTGSAVRRLEGDGTSRSLSPDAFPLWLFETQLADGAQLCWRSPETDEAVYVMSGELEVDATTCPEGGAVIVERGARATATANGPTTVAHFGSKPSPPSPSVGGKESGGGVHVVGPQGRFESGTQENVRAIWFADGTCESCQVQLFTVESPVDDDRRGRAHSHSQDEIIYLLDGAVSMGAHTFGPGTAVSIPADVRYALTAHDGGHRFLNFRRDVSWQIYELGSEPLLETAAARGGRATGDA